ncbi:MAG: UvrD-helicase domain-containing protein [Myxococcales bacterium]|nr:UvrD-helicase domain-containing protein [Myxococcales bacterium]
MMGDIHIVSASAGSGKTHFLATHVVEEIRARRVRPEAVVATTFTVRAAAELRERVRQLLLDADLVDEAQRILAARFGTVNSVCGRLLSEYAFELGLSPLLRVLDKAGEKRLLRQALDGARTPEQERRIEELAQRWKFLAPAEEARPGRPGRRGSDSFSEAIQEVIDLARSNRVDAGQLAACARSSLASFLRLLPPTTPRHKHLERELRERLEEFIGYVRGLPDPDKLPKKTLRAVQEVERFAQALKDNRKISWDDWIALERLDPDQKVCPQAEPIIALAREHAGLPGFKKDVEEIIGLLFDLARQGLERYRQHKEQRGLVDFVDQEVYALELLENDEVRRRLEGQIDLLVVDEFQDTSPIQLAIFLRLSSLAKRSVWVGDQKQAIYGFRGTDPSLMEAALKVILGERRRERLSSSYRSRPALVRLTSALFAPAFGAQDIPRECVELEPAEDREPEGLGPIVERWFTTGNRDVQAACVAAGVRGLLFDEDTRVRDKDTRQARRARAGDVAVLCRTQDQCESVAVALEAAGLRVARARRGLLATHEGQLVLAGLRLWLDPDDRLARAEVLRLLDFAGRPDEWLREVLDAAETDRQMCGAAIDRLLSTREGALVAGALQVFDEVCRTLEIREACLAWGDVEARLANLEALRELTVRYASDGAVSPGGPSPAGLLAFLDQVIARGEDEKPALADEHAVVVSTWHGSKGLEWPMVVLYGIEAEAKADPCQPQVIPAPTGIDLREPLAGRWIRYWPFPYSRSRTHGALLERIRESEEARINLAQKERELLRVLYVIWTRARDRVILACKEGELEKGCLSLLNHPAKVIGEPEGEQVCWAGRPVDLAQKRLAPLEHQARAPAAGLGYPPAAPVGHPPAWANPSALSHRGTPGRAENPVTIGEPIQIKGGRKEINATDLGHAIHGFLAADRPGLASEDRQRMAEGLLSRWKVSGALTAADLVRAADALWAWINETFPGAKVHREIPIEHRLATGTVVRGFCDLALETDAGWVIVDHKSFTDDPERARERAGEYSGQLAAYADAIAATGRMILGMYLHLPLLGLIIPVSPPCQLENATSGEAGSGAGENRP